MMMLANQPMMPPTTSFMSISIPRPPLRAPSPFLVSLFQADAEAEERAIAHAGNEQEDVVAPLEGGEGLEHARSAGEAQAALDPPVHEAAADEPGVRVDRHQARFAGPVAGEALAAQQLDVAAADDFPAISHQRGQRGVPHAGQDVDAPDL